MSTLHRKLQQHLIAPESYGNELEQYYRMMDRHATPTNSSSSIQYSPSSPSAASTTAPSCPTTDGGFSDVQMEQLKGLIQPPLPDKLSDVQETQSKMQKTLFLLVEDKSRQMACNNIGVFDFK